MDVTQLELRQMAAYSVALKAWEEGFPVTLPDRPRGWRFLGEGSRKAYLASDGWVYKFHTYEGQLSNWSEWEGYRRLQGLDLPTGWSIPETKIIELEDTAVIKMEYIRRRSHISWAEGDSAWLPLGVNDAHSFNIRRCSKTKIKYLIDMEL